MVKGERGAEVIGDNRIEMFEWNSDGKKSVCDVICVCISATNGLILQKLPKFDKFLTWNSINYLFECS